MEHTSLSRDMERELTQRFSRGDTAAFEALMTAHAKWLFRFLKALLRNHHDAEDVWQETFANAWKARSNFDANGNARFSTWVLEIARNKAISLFRKSGKDQQRLLDVFEWIRPRTKKGVTQEPIPPQCPSAAACLQEDGLNSATQTNEVEATATPTADSKFGEVSKWLEGLGPKERTAFEARALAAENATDADLAGELGWDTGAFKTALSRARAKIKVIRDATTGGALAHGE